MSASDGENSIAPGTSGLNPRTPPAPLDEHELGWATFLAQAVVCEDNHFQKLLLTRLKDHVTDLDTLTGAGAVKDYLWGRELALRVGYARAGATGRRRDGASFAHGT
jgi:hypothetical protein